MESNSEKQQLPTHDDQLDTTPPPPYPANEYAYQTPHDPPPIYQPPGVNPYPKKAAYPLGLGETTPSNVGVDTPKKNAVIVTQPGAQVSGYIMF